MIIQRYPRRRREFRAHLHTRTDKGWNCAPPPAYLRNRLECLGAVLYAARLADSSQRIASGEGPRKQRRHKRTEEREEEV